MDPIDDQRGPLPPDDQLVAAIMAGDERTFRLLLDSWSPGLLRAARSYVSTTDSAEDVVQDTYLMARDRILQLRDPAAIEAWLARICVHRAFRIRRRGRRLHELLDALPFPRMTPAPQGRLELHELIEKLPARERAVVVLQHGYGYSLDEVATLVGVSHANARKISSRTRARLLREWLEAEA